MATTYNEMVALVQDYTNRDSEVITDVLAQQFLRWAADKCYRKLRVPSLEITREFTVTETDITTMSSRANYGLQEITIPVPQDLIDVIYIRTPSNGCVFEEKLDQRTFYQREAEKKTPAYWTRDGNRFKLSGRIGVGDVVDLHYYRRLPALNSMYSVTAANFNGQTMADQLLTYANPQPADQAAADTFLMAPGTGVLYFEQTGPVTVENFQLGLLTAVAPDTPGIDGSLWIPRAIADYEVTAQNWNESGMRDAGYRIRWVRTGTDFTGTLWFDPIGATEDYSVATSSNFITTDQVVAGEVNGITTVVRIRNGVETTMTRNPSDPFVPNDDQYDLNLNADGSGRVDISFSNPLTTDIYIVTYQVAPISPEGRPAFELNDGTRTSFNFTGYYDPALVIPTTPGIVVSATQSQVHNEEVFFIGGSEFTGEPVPGINMAYDNDLGPHSDPVYFTGLEVSHWLRDENERILLFGALAEAFIYLEEDNMIEKYKLLFESEIEELNREEKMRQAVGGNVQINFNGRGLI